jgi:hypothetical protein
MADNETFSGLSLDSITVDDAGRVIVTDPDVAERLRSSSEALRIRRVNEGCNTTRGCGDGQNVRCTINTR